MPSELLSQGVFVGVVVDCFHLTNPTNPIRFFSYTIMLLSSINLCSNTSSSDCTHQPPAIIHRSGQGKCSVSCVPRGLCLAGGLLWTSSSLCPPEFFNPNGDDILICYRVSGPAQSSVFEAGRWCLP